MKKRAGGGCMEDNRMIFKIGAVLLGLISLFSVLFHLQNLHLKVTKYRIRNKKIPKEFDGAVIVMLSDLHDNCFGKKNCRLIEQIQKQKPDYIILAGDMLVGYENAENRIALDFILELVKKYKVYYAYGNHEEKLRNLLEESSPAIRKEDKNVCPFEEYIDILRKAGVHFLVNESVMLDRGGKQIQLTGLNIDRNFFKKWKRPVFTVKYLNQVLPAPVRGRYQILIAHTPMYFNEYRLWGADLTLSGHVHGGIVRIPFLGGVISPQYILFPKYDRGMFAEEGKTLLVSAGLGTHTIKVRLWNRPELLSITLQKNLDNYEKNE